MATGTNVGTKGGYTNGNTDRVREILSWYESDNPGVRPTLPGFSMRVGWGYRKIRHLARGPGV